MTTTLHPCPGLCGAMVARHLLACKPCWLRLPADLRRAVDAGWLVRLDDGHRSHRAAMKTAAVWYREHAAVAT